MISLDADDARAPVVCRLSNSTCTRDAVEACIESNSTRTCDPTEHPVGVKGSCCPSCIPEDFHCDKDDVARCMRDSRPVREREPRTRSDRG